MGQKTHPTGFRVGIIQDWASTWYAKWKDYKTFVAEDAKIRKFVKKNYTLLVYLKFGSLEKHKTQQSQL